MEVLKIKSGDYEEQVYLYKALQHSPSFLAYLKNDKEALKEIVFPEGKRTLVHQVAYFLENGKLSSLITDMEALKLTADYLMMKELKKEIAQAEDPKYYTMQELYDVDKIDNDHSLVILSKLNELKPKIELFKGDALKYDKRITFFYDGERWIEENYTFDFEGDLNATVPLILEDVSMRWSKTYTFITMNLSKYLPEIGRNIYVKDDEFLSYFKKNEELPNVFIYHMNLDVCKENIQYLYDQIVLQSTRNFHIFGVKCTKHGAEKYFPANINRFVEGRDFIIFVDSY